MGVMSTRARPLAVGAIVTAAGAPFEIGSDFGGSIRLPSHFCGTAGLKPSSGRVPRTGHTFPFGGVLDSFQQIGPLARYVEDLALILPLIAGPDLIDPGIVSMPLADPRQVQLSSLRVGFHTDNGIRTPTAEIQSVVRDSTAALTELGVPVEESRPGGIERSFEVGLALYFAGGGAAQRRLLKQAGTTEHTFGEFGPPLSADELDQAVDNWYQLRSTMLSLTCFDS